MVLRNVSRHPFRAAASIFGIGFAVAILVIGFVFTDAMEKPDRNPVLGRRAAGRHRHLRRAAIGGRTAYALARLPGVIAVEPQRTVAARIRAGHRERYLAITGVPPNRGSSASSIATAVPIRMPPSGVVSLGDPRATCSASLPGDEVTIEVLEGARPVRHVRITGLVDDILGCRCTWTWTPCTHDAGRRRRCPARCCSSTPAQEAALSARAEGGCPPSPAPASSGPWCRAFATRWPRT